MVVRHISTAVTSYGRVDFTIVLLPPVGYGRVLGMTYDVNNFLGSLERTLHKGGNVVVILGLERAADIEADVCRIEEWKIVYVNDSCIDVHRELWLSQLDMYCVCRSGN